ncbi:MAG: endo alpha-1,4 polygalactosaminidase [Deltaproteobacteria bacterium]|nr:endo alpha-1,4 polygalactosaminidase [Deltaproteobacteria bacterium]
MKPPFFLPISFFLIFLSLACSSSGTSDDSGDDGSGDGGDGATLLAEVNNWAYWLQDIDVDDLATSGFDLAVIDYSSDGSEEEAFSADEIETLQSSGMIVLSYISIGEAEDYRYYFDADAGYVDEENPDWPGNFKVRYWEEAWQEVIESYIDRVVDAGFDGAYFDIIDAYEYYGPGGDSGVDRESAADDMVNFVIRLADYARESDADFLIFPQNGAAIIDDSSLSDEYLSAVNGIGAEDTFYFGDLDNDNELDSDNAGEITPLLDRFVSAGKTVLTIDYLTDPDKIDDFYDRAESAGYIPYSSIRDLDELTIPEGHEPE